MTTTTRNIIEELKRAATEQGTGEAVRTIAGPTLETWMRALDGKDADPERLDDLATLMTARLSIRDAALIAAVEPKLDTATIIDMAARPHSSNNKTLLTETLKAAFDDPHIHPDETRLARAVREACAMADRARKHGGPVAQPYALAAYLAWGDGDGKAATLAAIAAEKSGILKPGCRAVLYGQSREVGEVVARACVEKNIPLTVTDDSQLTLLSSGLDGQRFTYRGSAPLLLPLLGDYQLRNAMTVLDTVDALRAQGRNISADAVAHGLAAARWPGRLELVHRRPDLIIDGGHNPQCAQALAASLRGLYGGKKLIFLIGVLADKDWQSMVGEVLPLAKAIVTVRPESERAKDENELAAWVRAQGVPAEAHASIGEALDAVLALAGPEDAVCAWGSLYSVGELRHCLGLC